MNNEVTRRGLLRTLGAVAGAAVVVPHTLRAQSKAAPQSAPTVISNPPRDFGPNARADDVLHRPGCAHGGPGVRRAGAGEYLDTAHLDRRALDRGAGMEQPGPLSSLERHPEQPADAVDGRRRARGGVSKPVEQQQREHVSTTRDASCPANTSRAASSATSTTVRSRLSRTHSRASG